MLKVAGPPRRTDIGRRARLQAARPDHSNRRYRPCPTVCDGPGETLRASGVRYVDRDGA